MRQDTTLSLVPFVLPSVIPTNRNTKCGRGVIVPVTATAGTPVVITHNLGRLVQGLIAINNGTAYTPRLAMPAGTRTTTQQTIQGDVNMTSCLVWVF